MEWTTHTHTHTHTSAFVYALDFFYKLLKIHFNFYDNSTNFSYLTFSLNPEFYARKR